MSPNPNIPGEMDYDLVDLQLLSNNGRQLTGQAVLCGLDGGMIYVFFSHARGDVMPTIQPEPYTSASALLWLSVHGMADLRNDVEEALAAQRDSLRDLDVQSGPLLGFSWDDWSIT